MKEMPSPPYHDATTPPSTYQDIWAPPAYQTHQPVISTPFQTHQNVGPQAYQSHQHVGPQAYQTHQHVGPQAYQTHQRVIPRNMDHDHIYFGQLPVLVFCPHCLR